MIKLMNVTKKFGGVEALSKVSCTIPDGQIYGLVGSNGAGKSTLLRILAGIYKPNSGEVHFDGEPVWDNPKVKEKFVFVPDELYFLPGANMKKMAKFYQQYYPSFSMKRFESLSKTLKLDLTKPLSGFSKGMRKQAAVVLALSCMTKYYFFDETFDGLDAVMRQVVKKMIFEDICERNVTAVISSHSLRELEDTCDHLALLHQGGIMFDHEVEHMKTALVKIRFALKEDVEREEISKRLGDGIRSFQKDGHLFTAIIEGNATDAEERVKILEPVFVEVLPLGLEEFFTYEMNSLGYSFTLEVDENETTV